MCLLFDRFLGRERVKLIWTYVLPVILLVPYGAATANTWQFQPAVGVNLTYTDNITLAPAGQQRDEFVTEVDPGFSLASDGPRLKLNFDYTMQNLFYAHQSKPDYTYHHLNAGETSTLIDNLLYFDSSGSISQQVINPQGKAALDNISITSNRTNVSTYSFTPYLHHDFGTAVTAEARYEYNRVVYSQAGQSNSNGRSVSALLRSGPSFDRISWYLSHSEQRILYDLHPDVSLKRTEAQVGYATALSLSVNGSVGYESNRYNPIDTTSGKTWSVGFKWAPGSRTSLTASYGRRVFGTSYSAELLHKTRHTTWRANYSETITSARDLQLATQTIGLVNTSGQVLLVNVIFPELNTETFVNKVTQVSMDKKLRSGSLSMQFRDEYRIYQSSGDREHVYGPSATLGWRLNRQASVSFNGAWQRYDYRGGGRHDDFWSAGASLSDQLSREIQVGLEVNHIARASTVASSEYSENRVIATLKMHY